MTLPASGTITLTQVMAELRVVTPGRAYPISLGDSDVRSLAGVTSGPISLTTLYGKSSFVDVPITGSASNDDKSYTSSLAGNADTFPTAHATGGNSALTYSWSFTSNPDGCVIAANGNTPTPTIRKAFARFATGIYSADLQCVITDTYGHSLVVTCNVSADWSY